MTKVNVLLPLFQTSLATNNSEVISNILRQKYGIVPSFICWLPEVEDCFECVVRLPNFTLNFDAALQHAERAQTVEETLKRLQVDIFNVVKKHQQLFQERKNLVPLDRMRGEIANEVEDSEVSLKIEEKPKPTLEANYSEQQLLGAIRELTQQNLKLKDAIIFYEAQLELAKVSEFDSARPR